MGAIMLAGPFLNHCRPPHVADSWVVDVLIWHGATVGVGWAGTFFSTLNLWIFGLVLGLVLGLIWHLQVMGVAILPRIPVASI